MNLVKFHSSTQKIYLDLTDNYNIFQNLYATTTQSAGKRIHYVCLEQFSISLFSDIVFGLSIVLTLSEKKPEVKT